MDGTLEAVVTKAIARLEAELRAELPREAGRITDWMRRLSADGRAETRFLLPEQFPMLLMPWLLGKKLGEDPGDAFHEDNLYAMITSYYFIRLIDNLMDRESTVELSILPSTAFFHTRFQAVYQAYFGPDHPFWSHFRLYWLGSAEFAMRDARLERIDRAAFVSIAAKKICAAKIPVAAACYRCRREDLIPSWDRFYDLLGCYQQMLDDMSDWRHDMTCPGTTTYFLSEAAGRRRPEESVLDWIAREGFRWGMGELAGWMAEMEALARSLDCAEVGLYLGMRKTKTAVWETKVSCGLDALGRLRSILRGALD
jgi:hypothetical protein